MIRTLKALGFALMAVGAISAVAASGASAATFHCESGPCIGTATTEEGTKEVFAASGLTVQCHGSFGGTQSTSTASTLTLFPKYTSCTSNIATPTVTTTGCDYIFSSTTNGSGHLPTSIECTTGSVISIAVAGCTLTFGSQGPVTGGVKATNIGSGSTREMTTDITASDLTFTKHGGFACLFISGDTATYTAKEKLSCWIDNGVTGNLDGLPTHPTFSEGAQTGCWWE